MIRGKVLRHVLVRDMWRRGWQELSPDVGCGSRDWSDLIVVVLVVILVVVNGLFHVPVSSTPENGAPAYPVPIRSRKLNLQG